MTSTSSTDSLTLANSNASNGSIDLSKTTMLSLQTTEAFNFDMEITEEMINTQQALLQRFQFVKSQNDMEAYGAWIIKKNFLSPSDVIYISMVYAKAGPLATRKVLETLRRQKSQFSNYGRGGPRRGNNQRFRQRSPSPNCSKGIRPFQKSS